MSKTIVSKDNAFLPGGFAEGDRIAFLTVDSQGRNISVEARVTDVLYACTPEQRARLTASGHDGDGYVYNDILYVPCEFLWR